jgi:hypothetical protein
MSKTLVCSFGRANPPHQGHITLVDEVVKVAKEHHGDAAVFLSKTNDKKNPLPYDVKVKLMNKWSKGVVKIDNENKVKQPGNMLHYANEHGYTDIIILCGSDRYAEYSKSLPEFAESRDYFNFNSVTVQALKRNPDAEEGNVSGMSGTLMRKYVTDDNFDSFRKALPTQCSDSEAKEIWDLAKEVLVKPSKKKIKEGYGMTLTYEDFRQSVLESVLYENSGTVSRATYSALKNRDIERKNEGGEYEVYDILKSGKMSNQPAKEINKQTVFTLEKAQAFADRIMKLNPGKVMVVLPVKWRLDMDATNAVIELAKSNAK